MAAPVIKPSMVVLLIEGVLVANIKPATAIHKVQRTMRVFMGVLLTAAGCLFPPLPGRCFALEGNLSIG